MDRKDMLYSLIFNKYRDNIIDASYINMNVECFLDTLLDNNSKKESLLNFSLIRKYLLETNPVDTYQEIIDIININDIDLRRKYNTVFSDGYLKDKLEKEIKYKLLKEDNSYSYFDSKKVYGANDKIDKIEKIDYQINIETYDNEDFALHLIEICHNNNIPYLFQLSKNNKSIILKTDEKKLNIFKEYINKYKENNKEVNIIKLKKEPKKNTFQFIKKLINK